MSKLFTLMRSCKRSGYMATFIAAAFAFMWALFECGYVITGSWVRMHWAHRSVVCMCTLGALQFAFFFPFYLCVCQLSVRKRMFAVLVFLPLVSEYCISQIATGYYGVTNETLILSSFSATPGQIALYASPVMIAGLGMMVAVVVLLCVLKGKIWKTEPTDTWKWFCLWVLSIAIPLVFVKYVPGVRYRLARAYEHYSPYDYNRWFGNSPDRRDSASAVFRQVADKRRLAEVFLPYNRISQWVEITCKYVLFADKPMQSAQAESSFTPASNRLCVILYVAEAFRADRLPFAGYHRNTMPKTTAAFSKNIIHLPNVTSYDTFTVTCLRGILSDEERESGKITYNSFQSIFKKHGFHCLVMENNCDGAPWSDSPILRPCLRGTWDEHIQLSNAASLAEPIAVSIQKHPYNMVVMEDGCGHDPYPEATGTLWGDKLVDLYDEARLATDSHFEEVLQQVRHIPSIVLFVSDHGESLGEEGRVRHGGSLAAVEQRHVAAFVWYSDEYGRLYPEVVRNLRGNAQKFTSQELIFHTMPTLGRIRSAAQKKEMDMAARQE